MLAAYEAGIDGTPRERRSAERMWPAVVATEQLAYRTLRCCWSMDRDASSEAAGDIRRSLFGPDGADQFTTTLGELATVVRHGSTTHDLGQLPLHCAAELTSLRDSLVRDTD